MKAQELQNLLSYLISLPKENEWVEFKVDNEDPMMIGERLSALANSACLVSEPFGYLVYGVVDVTHEVVGTPFRAKMAKKGNEDLEMWLLNRLNPRIDMQVYEFDYETGKHISLFKIPAAFDRPVKFMNVAYVRINSCTRKLFDFPEKEAKIWRNVPKTKFEEVISMRGLSGEEVFSYLSSQDLFDLLGIPYPSTREAMLEKFASEKMIVHNGAGWDITNMGAILFAKDLSRFGSLKRKMIRIITYKGTNRMNTLKDEFFEKGYALSFEEAIKWIDSQTPTPERIGPARRSTERAYPEKSIREIFGNIVVHQCFEEEGFPTVEIFENRIEFSNPGTPLISVDRFIDEYKSRNDVLTDVMRRMGFCEEKGSGMDKAVMSNESFLLPAIGIRVQENRTVVILYARKTWAETNRQERLQACYQHACVKYVSHEAMTNQTLRERFNIEEQNASMVSRVIRDAIVEGLVKEEDPDNASRKYKRYIPYWA
jgi:predicted HTH transcriptional regulator